MWYNMQLAVVVLSLIFFSSLAQQQQAPIKLSMPYDDEELAPDVGAKRPESVLEEVRRIRAEAQARIELQRQREAEVAAVRLEQQRQLEIELAKAAATADAEADAEAEAEAVATTAAPTTSEKVASEASNAEEEVVVPDHPQVAGGDLQGTKPEAPETYADNVTPVKQFEPTDGESVSPRNNEQTHETAAADLPVALSVEDEEAEVTASEEVAPTAATLEQAAVPPEDETISATSAETVVETETVAEAELGVVEPAPMEALVMNEALIEEVPKVEVEMGVEVGLEVGMEVGVEAEPSDLLQREDLPLPQTSEATDGGVNLEQVPTEVVPSEATTTPKEEPASGSTELSSAAAPPVAQQIASDLQAEAFVKEDVRSRLARDRRNSRRRGPSANQISSEDEGEPSTSTVEKDDAVRLEDKPPLLSATLNNAKPISDANGDADADVGADEAAAEAEALREISQLQQEEDRLQESEGLQEIASQARAVQLEQEEASRLAQAEEAASRQHLDSMRAAGAASARQGAFSEAHSRSEGEGESVRRVGRSGLRPVARGDGTAGGEAPAQSSIRGGQAPGIVGRGGMGSLNLGGALEDLLPKADEGLHSQAQQEHAQSEQERAWRLPRKIARPVERVLEIYENEKTDLYDVLGVSHDCDDSDLRAAYRSQALLMHPDKNPHPQAKRAFDALQEAYKTLASPTTRSAYDDRLRRSTRRPMTAKRLWRLLRDEIDNRYSRFLLLQHRVRNGRWQEEYQEVAAHVTAARQGLEGKLEHFAHLERWPDRIELLHEIWARYWREAAATAITVGCIL